MPCFVAASVTLFAREVLHPVLAPLDAILQGIGKILVAFVLGDPEELRAAARTYSSPSREPSPRAATLNRQQRWLHDIPSSDAAAFSVAAGTPTTYFGALAPPQAPSTDDGTMVATYCITSFTPDLIDEIRRPSRST